jgi:hypothetical protein
MTGIFLSDYVAEFDRIVRHAKNIALAESQPYFWIKRRKLDRVAPEMPEPPPPGEGAPRLPGQAAAGRVCVKKVIRHP